MPKKKDKSKTISRDSGETVNSKCKKEEIDINKINRSLQYESVHNSKKFLEASTEERVKILMDYVELKNKEKREIARRSYISAPLSQIYNIRIIPSSVNNHEDDCNNNYSFEENISMKEDENVLSQSIRNVPKDGNKENDEKENRRNVFKDVDVYDFKIENSSDESDDDFEYLPNGKSKKKPRVQRVTKEKKNTNERKKKVSEKKTALKSYSPVNTNVKINSTRAEMLFDKLKEQEKRRKKEDDAMEKFNKALNELESENTDNETDEKMSPVLPVRRNYKRKNLAYSKDETVPKKRIIKEKSTKTQSNNAKTNNQPSTSQTLQQCPLCGDNFSQNIIEEHAAICDGKVSAEVDSPISCSICQKVILTPERYLEHKRECEKGNN